MKRFWKFAGPLMAIVVVTATVIFNFAAESAPDSWRSKMGELSAAISETIPFLYPDPKQDSKMLTQKIKRVYEISKQIDGKLAHSMQMPDSDPALPYIANLLRADLERAYHSMQEGHTDYAKSVIRSSVAYCIACHTRSPTGVEFPLLKAFAEPLKRASWIERIEFQTASRQFDAVVTEVMQQLDSPGTMSISSLDLERGSRLALSVLVRYKQDPVRANLLANSIIKSKNASSSMKEAAKVWQRDIQVWQTTKTPPYTNANQFITAARALIENKPSEILPIGAYTEVRYLRASLLMHDLLRRFPKSEQIPQALYIIGQSYEALGEIGLWSLHEVYYMACIEKQPHTRQSEQCFKKYEQSVTLGYAGSSGIHIPKAVRQHLDQVKLRATVRKPSESK